METSPRGSAARHPEVLRVWLATVPRCLHDTLLASLSVDTKKGYFSVFRRFLRFLAERGQSFRSFQLQHLLLFLQGFLDQHFRFSTVNSAYAAVAWFVRRSSRKHLLADIRIRDFLRGSKRIAVLPARKIAVWNPQFVIDFVRGRPRPTSFLGLAEEAIVLLLLATGVRLDDVFKMAFPPCFSRDAVRVHFRALRKPDISGQPSGPLDLQGFPEERVCPVKALQLFVEVSEGCRLPSSSMLFISSKGSDASKDTLRRWVKTFLSRCGIFSSPGSFRSVATSMAFLKSVPIAEIMKMAGWRVASTFRRHYCRPIAERRNLLSSWVQ